MEKYILFGASNLGLSAYYALKSYSNILFFCDNDPEKWGQRIEDVEIIAPEKLLMYAEDTTVIITSMYGAEISRQLMQMGIGNFRTYRYDLTSEASISGVVYDDLFKRIDTRSPIIVDGGANSGQTVDIFLEHFDSPIIHAFEPIPQLAEELERKYAHKGNVIIYNNALGAQNCEASFFINENFATSSLLQPSDESVIKKQLNSDLKPINSIKVNQLRLDETVSVVDILKLDLQGYELEALVGSEKLLENVKAILVEVEFIRIYDGQPLFNDIDSFLKSKGFMLMHLYNLQNKETNCLWFGDAVYLNKQYFSN
ncbi:FkbM family methyltransferase [Paenibacillus albus]|uniref:FkbM family methyltransferase n=1 Tax=Paenibacillus albus TaxID=2495582 RepID=A0A3Q8X2D0_9BACL|nr:FkbM family methyltransferase [Paenibacillus albus]AZN38502.1 FkbM family methyltransferase [Paenibacillus albus]